MYNLAKLFQSTIVFINNIFFYSEHWMWEFWFSLFEKYNDSLLPAQQNRFIIKAGGKSM